MPLPYEHCAPCEGFGWDLAETGREVGNAQLKRIWQSEVTGPRRGEEAEVAGRDSSLVTETAGLRSKVFSLTPLAELSSGCSSLNSVSVLEFILKL